MEIAVQKPSQPSSKGRITSASSGTRTIAGQIEKGKAQRKAEARQHMPGAGSGNFSPIALMSFSKKSRTAKRPGQLGRFRNRCYLPGW